MPSNHRRFSPRLREFLGLLISACAILIARQSTAQQLEAGVRPNSIHRTPPTFTTPGDKGQQEPPSIRLDESLLKVLENHPEIVAAKAKVALAEAELNTKRFEIAQHIIPLFEQRRLLQTRLKELNDEYKDIVGEANKAKTREQVQQGADNINRAIREMGELQGSIANVDMRLGKNSFGIEAASLIDSLSVKSTPHIRLPEGPIVERIKAALDKPESAQFVETPLADILTYLTDNTDVRFSIAPALSGEGHDKNSPISLNINASLRATLQAIEDALPSLQFVVRDYGILVTTVKDAEERGFTPAVEFARQSATEGVKTFVREQPAPKNYRTPDEEARSAAHSNIVNPLEQNPSNESKGTPAVKPSPKPKSDDPFGG